MLVNRGDGIFAGRRNYAAGKRLSSLAIGDLNGDGKPDLATANGDANKVSVLDNRGDGGFEAKLDYQAGRGPWSGLDRRPERRRKAGPGTANFGANTVSVLISRPGLCNVQNVMRKPLPAAGKRSARQLHRRRIRRAYSKIVKPGRVIAQKPRFGAVLPKGGKVKLVVSGGP